MTKKQDYVQDIADIRSMMEKSSRFLSLSGWAGIMAGIYALTGSYIAYTRLHFQPSDITYPKLTSDPSLLSDVISLAMILLVLAVGTAIFLSYKKAQKRAETLWNPSSRRVVISTAIPLVAGGLLILILINKGLTGLLAPFTLLFYGLALFSAGGITFREIRYLGIIQIGLGLLASIYIEYSLLLWALGFGVMHIIYGTYIYIRHER